MNTKMHLSIKKRTRKKKVKKRKERGGGGGGGGGGIRYACEREEGVGKVLKSE